MAWALAVYAALLMLRVYDEHKGLRDRSKESSRARAAARPDHAGSLKGTGRDRDCDAARRLAVLRCGQRSDAGAVTQRWLLVFVWSALMAKEFFIGEWLTRHLLLYAISHMVVLPMAVLWVVQQGAGQAALTTNAYLLALVALLGGFAFEIGRKTRARPMSARPWTPTPRCWACTGGDDADPALGCAGGVLALLLFAQRDGLGPHGIGLGLAGLAALLPGAPLLSFLRQPSSRGSKGIEAAIALQTPLSTARSLRLGLCSEVQHGGKQSDPASRRGGTKEAEAFVGGKAAGLLRLHAAGAVVPAWFAVRTEAFWRTFTRAGLSDSGAAASGLMLGPIDGIDLAG